MTQPRMTGANNVSLRKIRQAKDDLLRQAARDYVACRIGAAEVLEAARAYGRADSEVEASVGRGQRPQDIGRRR